jgi:arylsulfatase A-like enzyme
MHPWLKETCDFIGNEVAMRSYACAVSGLDDGVGAILDRLAELGLERDTLVVFTADHGLCGGHHGMWGMGDHSRPLHMFQENLRVPLLFRHPDGIGGGQTVGTRVCNYDFFPSLLDYLGWSERRPPHPVPPGRSYAAALSGRSFEWGEDITFHEYENTRAVQTPEWKLVRRHPDGPDELYHLGPDPHERANRIEDPQCVGTREHLAGRLDGFFRDHGDVRYDLWRGGRSKAGRILEEPPG